MYGEWYRFLDVSNHDPEKWTHRGGPYIFYMYLHVQLACLRNRRSHSYSTSSAAMMTQLADVEIGRRVETAAFLYQLPPIGDLSPIMRIHGPAGT